LSLGDGFFVRFAAAVSFSGLSRLPTEAVVGVGLVIAGDDE
jgi:hypothetical protein